MQLSDVRLERFYLNRQIILNVAVLRLRSTGRRRTKSYTIMFSYVGLAQKPV